jgi:hypothetical protein
VLLVVTAISRSLNTDGDPSRTIADLDCASPATHMLQARCQSSCLVADCRTFIGTVPRWSARPPLGLPRPMSHRNAGTVVRTIADALHRNHDRHVRSTVSVRTLLSWRARRAHDLRQRSAPDDGLMPVANGVATIEVAAVNAAMARYRPPHFRGLVVRPG